MAIKNRKQYRRFRIKQRIRKTLTGTPDCPRMSVFRSNKAIYAQLIDDLNKITLISASTPTKKENKENKTQQATQVGLDIAKKAIEAGIEKIVFDRNGYLYHGRVKALAEAARKGGLKF